MKCEEPQKHQIGIRDFARLRGVCGTKEDWNKLLRMWSRGNPEEESSMIEERESQQHSKLAHSIEEILRRPTCAKKDTRVFRNWSVIQDNTRTSTGIF